MSVLYFSMKAMLKSMLFGVLILVFGCVAVGAKDYVVVTHQKNLGDVRWAEVVNFLRTKYGAGVVTYSNSVEEALVWLSRERPKYTAFVAQPLDVSREFVAKVHVLTRRLDDDPYGDTIWGIVTGFDAGNALELVGVKSPLIVRRAAGGTSIPLSHFAEGVWYSEGKAGFGMEKKRGEKPMEIKVPQDTTKLLVDELNGNADLFVTSGHATERDWQIGYTYKNGYFKSRAGDLFGEDIQGRRYEIKSKHPRVYLPVGNCLMGHIDGMDAMALAWMKSACVVQMIGYTVPTWFGYMGWGVLDYFVEQPGRFSLSEAFFANQQALLWCLEKNPKSKGHLFDRDVVAFYGDPAFEARLEKSEMQWEQILMEKEGVFTFTVRINDMERRFQLVDSNGSQRGGRPIFEFLPRRVGRCRVIEGNEFEPVITENFILVPQPAKGELTEFKIVFKEEI
ncbi:MAG: hypothetical protein N2487_05035 [Verrucomicrobiae bacterium]|nr:hypothetical protein [Verrucomicrobiae bacterium]